MKLITITAIDPKTKEKFEVVINPFYLVSVRAYKVTVGEGEAAEQKTAFLVKLTVDAFMVLVEDITPEVIGQLHAGA